MSLLNDYKEFEQTFSKVGIAGKSLMALSFFLSVSSITSLADAVFSWKGFIAEGLVFYKNYFVDPLLATTSKLGLSYSLAEVHAAVVASVSVGIGMRLILAGQQVAYRKINTEYGSNLRPNTFLYWAIALAFPPAIWLWYGFSDQTPSIWRIAGVAAVYPIFLVLPKEVMSRFGSGGGYLEKGEFSYFKGYYTYIGCIALCVGILGAVNAGLSRAA